MTRASTAAARPANGRRGRSRTTSRTASRSAYVRLRRLIAEDAPVIAGYDEPEWARRLHYERPIETSLEVLQAVRGASQQLLMTLTPDEWERSGTHSESGEYSVDDWLGIYSEHSHEHADQIRRARRGED